jgi:hypothetical protein
MKGIAISGLLLIGLAAIEVTAQQMPAKPRMDTNEAKIARALSAAPANIAEAAKIVDRDENAEKPFCAKVTMALLASPDTRGSWTIYLTARMLML